MSFFEYYYNQILKQELLTKYMYRNVFEVIKLEKIVLSFTLSSQTSLKSLLPLVSGLTIISSHRPSFILSKRISIVLKTRSGVPVGCRVDIRGKQKFFFIEKFVTLLSSLKNLPYFFRQNIVYILLENLFIFKEIEKDYEHFQELPFLTVCFVFNSKNRREITDFLNVFRFPKKKSYD